MTHDSPSRSSASSSSSSPSPEPSSSSTPTAAKPVIRGRPRSTSISNGSPGPAPGVALPSLFPPPPGEPGVIPPSPQNTLPSFTYPVMSFNPPWGSSNSSPGASSSASGSPGRGEGWGHRPSLSVPGILAPSPLVPGSVPRGGRHRRTQSVSPPGFPVLSASESSGFAPPSALPPGVAQGRRASGGDGPQLQLGRLGRLVIPADAASTEGRRVSPTGTTLSEGVFGGTGGGAGGGHQRRGSSPLPPMPGSPRRAGSRGRVVSGSSEGEGSSPTTPGGSMQRAQQVLEELHSSQASHAQSSHSSSSHSHSPHTHPPHTHSHRDYHHRDSHLALLQGVRSHSLPHSPTLDPSLPSFSSTSSAPPSLENGGISPLSSSPSSPSGLSSFPIARRRSGSSGATSLLSRSASPPFGLSSSPGSSSGGGFGLHHQPSPLAMCNAPFSPDEEVDAEEALGAAVVDDEEMAPLPPPIPQVRRGSMSSPPLLPLSLPPEASPAFSSSPLSPPIVGRARSGSITRATSSATSPASLYLEHEEPLALPRSPIGGAQAGGAVGAGPGGTVQGRPLSPPLEPPAFAALADALFPTSGKLPPPPLAASKSPEREEQSFLGLQELQQQDGEAFAHPPAPIPLPLSRSPPLTRPSLPRSPSGLSATRPRIPSGGDSSPRSPLLQLAADDVPPPPSPRGSPVALPVPSLEGAPSPLPAHLTPGARRSRSSSGSRSSSRSRSRSRSRSAEREELPVAGAEGSRRLSPPGSIGMPPRAIPAELVRSQPRVHSPLASPVVDDESEPEAEPEADAEVETEAKAAEQGEKPAEEEKEKLQEQPQGGLHSPGLGLGNLEPAPSPTVSFLPDAAPSPSSAASLPAPTLAQLQTSALNSGVTSPTLDEPSLVEYAISPSSPTSSYFSLPSGTHAAPPPQRPAASPAKGKRASAVPPLERAPSWDDFAATSSSDDDGGEDEFGLDLDDADGEDFFAGDDGSGEVGFSAPLPRRRSSGEKGQRRSLLEELGIMPGSGDGTGGVSTPMSIGTGSVPAPASGAGEGRQEEGAGRGFGALGFMEVDLSSSSASSSSPVTAGPGSTSSGLARFELSAEGEGEEGQGEEDDPMLAIDEESLSMLERIFVCAKSEVMEDRARVAYFLPEWLPGVDICEAVEYVLPLLAGLIEDESVKEVFAPKLDGVMWHFFSNCPLAELDPSSEDGGEGHKPGSSFPAASPDLNNMHPPSFTSAEPSPTSSHFPVARSDESGTPPPTSKTSPANSTVPLACEDGASVNADAPRISATAFTSLLGALLTDQSSYVAKSTEAALVRFLCRLKGRPLPPPDSPDEPEDADFAFNDAPDGPKKGEGGEDKKPYLLSQEANQLLEDEMVSGIVLGLARLDEDDKDGMLDAAADAGEDSSFSATGSPQAARSTPLPVQEQAKKDEIENPTLFMSPEEDPLGDEWLSGIDTTSGEGGEESTAGPAADSWGQPLVPASSTGNADQSQQQPNGNLNPAALLQSMSSPVGEPLYSTFSPDHANADGDEEASIGKMVSMSLIGAIAEAECLDEAVFVEQFLPEVARMKDDSAYYVRKEAVQALGNLAQALPQELLISAVLPLWDAFSADSHWHVRRAAVLALPPILKLLRPAALRSLASKAIALFAADDNRNVRSGALEICGELIYLFHENPDGVPSEVLSFFLGQPSPSAPPAPAPAPADPAQSPSLAFSPLRSALDSPPSSSFLESSHTWSPVRPWPSNRDPDREILTAFNLPAVILTLGATGWPALRDMHRTLCQDRVEKVRQSLASSLFEVARIIGPEQADQSLLEPLGWFLKDVDNIQAAVVENLPSLMRSFSPQGGMHALVKLNEAWGEIRLWRQREYAAKQLQEVGPPLMQEDGADAVLGVLVKAFKDPVAAVREQAVQAIPPLVEASLSHHSSRNKLFAFLHVFATDSSYRNRSVYVSCALACVVANISRDLLEEHFLENLTSLARDKVVSVRIAVARAVGKACRTDSLYADPATRSAISELIFILAQSPDRDVKQPVLDFYTPSPSLSEPQSPGSPPPDRAGARSRMDMYDDAEATPSTPSSLSTAFSPPLPADLSTPSAPSHPDDSLMSDDFPSPFQSVSSSSSLAAGVPLPSPDADDIEMSWDEALCDAIETKEAEGGEFVEVSRRERD
ncbi:hypothetical protein JCM10213_007593 [Rhodosporidiobolus nylandii]